jgi:transposase-like protein
MTSKKKCNIHSSEFTAEALKLAEKVGVAVVARQLSLHESQIYGWRKATKCSGQLKLAMVLEFSQYNLSDSL